MLMGVISQYTSWRIAFLILGTPGFVLVLLLVFTVRDPSRGQVGSNKARVDFQGDEYDNNAEQDETVDDSPKIEEVGSSINVLEQPYVTDFLGQIKILLRMKPFIRYKGSLPLPPSLSSLHSPIHVESACGLLRPYGTYRDTRLVGSCKFFIGEHV